MDAHNNHLGKPAADKNTCQEIYWNLLHFSKNNNSSSTLSTHFIRELEQTKHCDNIIKDFSTVREAYRSHIGTETHDKIMAQTKRDEDLEYVATLTVNHYSHWTQKELISALPLRLKLLYYTVECVENIKADKGFGFVNNMGAFKVIENYKKSM